MSASSSESLMVRSWIVAPLAYENSAVLTATLIVASYLSPEIVCPLPLKVPENGTPLPMEA